MRHHIEQMFKYAAQKEKNDKNRRSLHILKDVVSYRRFLACQRRDFIYGLKPLVLVPSLSIKKGANGRHQKVPIWQHSQED